MLIRRKAKAFTLMELLIVLGILAILAAIVVPTLAGAFQAAVSLKCRAGLRQWTVAMAVYAKQNDSCLPRRGQGVQPTAIIDRPEDWFNALPPLMGMTPYWQMAAEGQVPRPGESGVWMCPEAQDVPGAQFFAYGMNMRLSTWMAGVPDRLSQIQDRDLQVFMADGPGAYCSVLPSSKPYSIVARHRDGVNISFLDGHAGEFSGEYAGCGTGDPQRDDIRWKVPGSLWPGPAE